MKYSTVKLKTGLAGIWEGIFKEDRSGIFMRNYANVGSLVGNLIGTQWVRYYEKDHPWNFRQARGKDR